MVLNKWILGLGLALSMTLSLQAKASSCDPVYFREYAMFCANTNEDLTKQINDFRRSKGDRKTFWRLFGPTQINYQTQTKTLIFCQAMVDTSWE